MRNSFWIRGLVAAATLGAAAELLKKIRTP
jgi:hypothetical protein